MKEEASRTHSLRKLYFVSKFIISSSDNQTETVSHFNVCFQDIWRLSVNLVKYLKIQIADHSSVVYNKEAAKKNVIRLDGIPVVFLSLK